MKHYKPTQETREKFDQNGNAREYLGNTIVSMMNTKDFLLSNLANEIQTELGTHLFAEKFYMLPEESFHMTVIPLLNEVSRGDEEWPDYLPKDISMSEADDILLDKVSSVEKPQNIQMKLTKITPERLELEPANEETDKALKEYRDEIARVTDTKRENHEDYQFHLSISYIFEALTESENNKLQEVLNKLNEEYMDYDMLIQVPEPKFVIYNDMLDFYTDLDKRVE